MIDENYFGFGDIRPLAGLPWIPLRMHRKVELEPGDDALRIFEYSGIATAAIDRAQREAGDRVSWEDLKTAPHRSVYDTDDIYYPADQYRSWRDGIIGISLVIDQFIEETGEHVWHLHPDLVVALALVREGDVWFRPDEGWVEVVRFERDAKGAPTRAEIRLEHLRDYLAARSMDLLASSYHDRAVITDGRPPYEWPEDFRTFENGRDTHELSIRPSRFGTAKGQFQTLGALWRTEWVDGGDRSPRVRGDADDESVSFVVDAEGKRLPANQVGGGLDWLYFRPAIVNALLRRKGATLDWFSAETGSLGATGFGVHFGVNEIGLITVFAKDIGRLASWEQRLWSAENVAPEGDVSMELFAAQMEVNPAETVAPEAELFASVEQVDQAFIAKFGEPLLRPNERIEGIGRRTHRFIATQDEGLLTLAKELTRLFAERVDIDAIDKIVKLPKNKNGSKPGSLKSVQTLFATLIPEAEAHALMGPLFGILDLRIADAHLGNEKIASGIERAMVDPKQPDAIQGRQLLQSFVDTMKTITGHLA